MIIPSIDLMGGRAVQLRQGKDHVLTADEDPLDLIQRFNRYGEVAVIDLDAALGKGDNLALIRQLCRVADVRVGGGIRDVKRADTLLRAGAKALIVGTAATPDFLCQLPKDRVMVSLDHRGGQVVDQGWTNITHHTVQQRAIEVQDCCSSYLCTFVADEGEMRGMDIDVVTTMVGALPHPATVAGGVAANDEVITLSKLGIDVQVGMALYTGKLNMATCVVDSLDWEKCPHMPTIVQDEAGQVLMLAYSTPESLTQALESGTGTYYSRSRQGLWTKGETSGHTQALVKVRVDCDRDALLFTVTQDGVACHRDVYSCFGAGQQGFSMPRLFAQLQDRKANLATSLEKGSFTAKLFSDRKLLLRKILEEAAEACLADNRDEMKWEIADAIFFLSVLAADEGLAWHDLVNELGGRHR
jgi:phosphoribosyl-ATP pyrophosphohydrolase/phosphoribosyl-AMP cyclohydrolase